MALGDGWFLHPSVRIVSSICGAILLVLRLIWASRVNPAFSNPCKLGLTSCVTPVTRLCFTLPPSIVQALNQVEMWFSILMRKLLKRANFISKAQLKIRILEFIDYFNRTMAKPFKWTYQGKALKQ